ncbi:uncharacterized protein F5Z01DRAFT_58161 [Emericellopsis atlantica]|uniref:Uncharacterized protein n=1 Tax=Emericellopsis atlantica TaxID=2614577 RepID=A0A9P7ZML6_9HYPO|nr:uncharacterized protein F5Z01DRAFT_58161 [Emericellopsis atlantica]KAG9254899.1 hypothetical protein F5Z01DRAFT_58161 [Emericellopsis atlantica]
MPSIGSRRFQSCEHLLGFHVLLIPIVSPSSGRHHTYHSNPVSLGPAISQSAWETYTSSSIPRRVSRTVDRVWKASTASCPYQGLTQGQVPAPKGAGLAASSLAGKRGGGGILATATRSRRHPQRRSRRPVCATIGSSTRLFHLFCADAGNLIYDGHLFLSMAL